MFIYKRRPIVKHKSIYKCIYTHSSYIHQCFSKYMYIDNIIDLPASYIGLLKTEYYIIYNILHFKYFKFILQISIASPPFYSPFYLFCFYCRDVHEKLTKLQMYVPMRCSRCKETLTHLRWTIRMNWLSAPKCLIDLVFSSAECFKSHHLIKTWLKYYLTIIYLPYFFIHITRISLHCKTVPPEQ